MLGKLLANTDDSRFLTRLKMGSLRTLKAFLGTSAISLKAMDH